MDKKYYWDDISRGYTLENDRDRANAVFEKFKQDNPELFNGPTR